MTYASMTLEALHSGNALAVIDHALPSDASPLLLGEARDCCLSLIERLEFVYRHPAISDGEDGEEFNEPSPWHELSHGAADKMRRARLRLTEIDHALYDLGFDPEHCGYGRPLPH